MVSMKVLTELSRLWPDQKEMIRACIQTDGPAMQACLKNIERETEFYLEVRDFLRKYSPASESYLGNVVNESIVRTIDSLKE